MIFDPFERKNRILEAIHEVDANNTGLIKVSLFHKLIDCMSFHIEKSSLDTLLTKYTSVLDYEAEDVLSYERIIQNLT